MIKVFYNVFKVYKDKKFINSINLYQMIMPDGTLIKDKIDFNILNDYIGEEIEIYYNKVLKDKGIISKVEKNNFDILLTLDK